jgi:hypothetical protein
MGISFKIFPGVRIGVTRRGMNASVGPRIARVHAGPGGIRYSSGLGPVTVSGGGSRRRRYRGSSGSWDFAAFDEAMRVSPEQRTERLEREISRLERRGWKVVEKKEFSAKMNRKTTQKRKLTWIIVFTLLLYVSFDDLTKTILRSPDATEGPLSAKITVIVIFASVLLWQALTFARAKAANRKFEVGEYGVLHKHYHG